MKSLWKKKKRIRENKSTDRKDILHEFEGLAFPIITRVFARSMSNELVSVQPLGATPEPENVYSRRVLTEKTNPKNYEFIFKAPSGLLFYLDYKYGIVGFGNEGAATRVVLTEKYKEPELAPLPYETNIFFPDTYVSVTHYD